MDYEYRVVPAPKRLKRKRGATTEEICAETLTEAINAEARQGWEYLRAETLTAQEAGGWFRRGAIVEETMLVFRRTRVGQRLTAVLAERLPEPDVRVPEAHLPEPLAAERRAPEVRAERRAPDAWAPEPRAERVIPREPEARTRRVPQIESARPRPLPDDRAEATPSLLRPVPRFRPGDPS